MSVISLKCAGPAAEPAERSHHPGQPIHRAVVLVLTPSTPDPVGVTAAALGLAGPYNRLVIIAAVPGVPGLTVDAAVHAAAGRRQQEQATLLRAQVWPAVADAPVLPVWETLRTGQDRWRRRRASTRLVQLALTRGATIILLPYFDTSWLDPDDLRRAAAGQLQIRVVAEPPATTTTHRSSGQRPAPQPAARR